MKNDSGDKHCSVVGNGVAPDFARRRHVIQSMASMPVLLTLASGTARANNSSLQCIGNETPGENDNLVCAQNQNDAINNKPRPPHWVFADPSTGNVKNPECTNNTTTELCPPGDDSQATPESVGGMSSSTKTVL